jgi:hypothetical protein
MYQEKLREDKKAMTKSVHFFSISLAARFTTMSVALLYIVILMAGCDTRQSVEPYEGNVYFKIFGRPGSEEGWDIEQTADGGFVMLGSTTNAETNDRDVLLVKTDASGNQQWLKKYGGPADQVGRSLIISSDGRLVMCGSTVTDTINNIMRRSIYALVTDASGTVLSENVFGIDTLDEYGTAVAESPEGDFFFTGTQGNQQFFLVKTNPSLDVITESYQGQEGFINLSAASIPMGNDIYYCFGSTSQVPNAQTRDDTDFFIMVYDADGRKGNFSGERYGVEGADDVGVAFVTAFGRSFLLGGFTRMTNRTSTFISKVIDVGNGNFQPEWEWMDNAAYNTRAASMLRSSSGDYIILNTILSDISANKDEIELVRLRTGATGMPEVVWRHSYGSTDDDQARGLLELEDGSIAVVGTASFQINNPTSVSKMFLMKVNRNGELIP